MWGRFYTWNTWQWTVFKETIVCASSLSMYPMITAYICMHLGHLNSPIFLVSFPSCSGCDWKFQLHLFLFLNWASALPPFAPLQRKCLSRVGCARGRWRCNLSQMWWLCWLSVSQEIWLYFLLSHCLESALEMGISLADSCLWQSVCILTPTLFFAGYGV